MTSNQQDATPADAVEDPQHAAWFIVSDGSRHLIHDIALVGRAPKPAIGEALEMVIAVNDPTMRTTKTHFSLGLDEAGHPWVCDRNSVGGTRIVKADGRMIECPPGQRVRVLPKARVEFGGLTATFEPA